MSIKGLIKGYKGHHGDYNIEILETQGPKAKVKFLDTGSTRWLYRINIARGEIKDLYGPNLYGRGFIGEGFTPNHIAYKTWQNMFTRCYNDKFHESCPTYQDCSVDKRWWNFQTFAEWFDATRKCGRYELDKDFKIKGNRIYSEETCLWIPKKINHYVCSARGSRGDLPLGVAHSTNSNKLYEIRCADGTGKRAYLGHYNDIDEAFLVYKTYKEKKIKELANISLANGEICSKVHEIICNYKIEKGD